MLGQINETKHTKTVISRPFGNSLDLRSVGDFNFFFFFFLPTQHMSRQAKKNVFCSAAEKKTFSHQFWWVGRETGNKTILL